MNELDMNNLKQKIENMREELNKEILHRKFCDPISDRVIELSKELDILILKYEKEIQKEDR